MLNVKTLNYLMFLTHFVMIYVFIGTSEIASKINENQMASISNDSKIEIINQDSGHWLDSMLNSDDE